MRQKFGTSLAPAKSNFDMKFTSKLVLVGALCVPAIAQACSCMAPPAPKVALEKSAAVFVGRVTSVEKSGSNNKFQFSVSKQWKGVDGNTASIVTATDSAACGINFDQDRDYLGLRFQNRRRSAVAHQSLLAHQTRRRCRDRFGRIGRAGRLSTRWHEFSIWGETSPRTSTLCKSTPILLPILWSLCPKDWKPTKIRRFFASTGNRR